MTSFELSIDKLATYTSYLFIFSLPWEGMGPRLFDFFDIPYILGGVMLLFWVIRNVYKNNMSINIFVFAVWFFLLLNIVSMLWTTIPAETFSRYIPYIATAITVLVITNIYQSKARIVYGLQFLIFGAFVLVFAIYIDFIVSAEIGTSYNPPGITPNRSGALIVVTLAPAWYLYKFNSKYNLYKVLNVINLLFCFLAPVAVILTSSRQTFLAMFFPIFYILYTINVDNDLSIGFKKGVIFGLSIISIISFIIPREAINRILLVYDMVVVDRDLGGDRLERYQLAIELFLDKPILGYGSGTSNSVMTDAAVGVLAERATVSIFNTYLTIIVELGIIGIISFISCYYIAIKRIRQIARYEAFMWLSMIAPWLFVGLVRDWGAFIFSWVILTLAVNSFYVDKKTF